MGNLLQYVNSFQKIKDFKSRLVYGDLSLNKTPLVSIAITTYKRPQLLKEAIDSALNQNEFSNYEIIIVDNDPEPDTETEKLMKTYNDSKIFYYKNETNLGMLGNLNRSIELSRGKWYTILHDDDLLHDTFLKEMLDVLAKNPRISFLKAAHNQLDERELNCEDKNSSSFKLAYRQKLASMTKKLRKLSIIDYIVGNPIGAPIGAIMEREKVIFLGGFKEDTYPSFDYVFYTRYCLDYNTYFYNKNLCSYRILKNEGQKSGVMVAGAKIHFDMINELVNKKFIRKLFLKHYATYYVLKSVQNTKNFWKVDVKEEELNFLGKNKKLHPLWNYFYFIFKQVWQIKALVK